MGVAKSTYVRVEKGNPTVSMGVYAMVLSVFGFGAALVDLVDARRDELVTLIGQSTLR